MATQSKKNKQVTKIDILTYYMEYVLEHEATPKSVFKFAKDHNFEEADFYKYFGNFDALKKNIWETFFSNAHELMMKNEEVQSYGSREKMLTFFYTFFEILTANRSYVLYVLDENEQSLKNLNQLKGLRSNIKTFATDLIEDDNDEKQYGFLKRNEKIYSEGAWIQFLFLLKFWKEDSSPDFEKTDIAIEKSVNTIFDVFDNTPLEKVFDLGKFLYKETMK
ncbi:MAG: TetR family transcriptional regulator C-terminal domain-containing protein [Psychroflexus sp.]